VSVRSVGRQYAHALYQVADHAQAVEAVGRDLAAFADLVDGHEQLRSVLETPMVVPRKKRALVSALVAALPEIRVEVARLLELMAERNRLMLLSEVRDAYRQREMEAHRMVAAEVVTAEPLDEAHRARLADVLGQATGRTVTISDRVDPSIVGGVVARVGSHVFDGSIVRQVERMREALLADA